METPEYCGVSREGLADEPDRLPGFRLFDGWITRDERERLLEMIDGRAWSTGLSRRTQHYGFRYRCRAGAVARVADVPPIPSLMASLGERLVAEGLFQHPAEQVIVNEYQPGQGIEPHIDHEIFGPVVAILSLGDAYPMRFERDGADTIERILPVASLAVLSGTCREAWHHSIPARRTDPTPTGPRQRARRVSVTFRPG